MALKGLDIFNLTPKTNCKDCGNPTCMAFAMKVAQGSIAIEKCPHMGEDAIAKLSDATAPPMKKIALGDGLSLGGETVLFRHDKTFVSKNLFAVSVCTECYDKKMPEIQKVDYDRLGERMYVELLNLEYNGDKEKYVELVKKAQGSGRALILDCKDIDAAREALKVCAASKPLLNSANPQNYEAMNTLASEFGVALGVTGTNLDELYDTVAALEKLGNKNLVLDVGCVSVKDAFANTIQIRRSAIKGNNRTFGYPSLVNVGKLAPGKEYLQTALASVFTEVWLNYNNGRNAHSTSAVTIRSKAEYLHRPAKTDEGRSWNLCPEWSRRKCRLCYHCRLRSDLLHGFRRVGAFRCAA